MSLLDSSWCSVLEKQDEMAPDYDVRRLLGGMDVQSQWGRVSPPEMPPFHRAPVLSLERGLCSFSSVPVLMLIMPPIKIYIKSYNAAGSHASDQSPVRAEMAVKRDRKIIHTYHFLLDTGLISKVSTS